MNLPDKIIEIPDRIFITGKTHIWTRDKVHEDDICYVLQKKSASKNELIINDIFQHWNSKKEKGNAWKGHRELTFEIKEAIRQRLKEYSPEQINKAIDNYAKILLSRDYKWSYAWTLRQFLTRHQPNERQDLQLHRFLENSFYEKDYLTDKAMKTTRVEYVEGIDDWIMKLELWQLIDKYKQATSFHVKQRIIELRPEIKKWLK